MLCRKTKKSRAAKITVLCATKHFHQNQKQQRKPTREKAKPSVRPETSSIQRAYTYPCVRIKYECASRRPGKGEGSRWSTGSVYQRSEHGNRNGPGAVKRPQPGQQTLWRPPYCRVLSVHMLLARLLPPGFQSAQQGLAQRCRKKRLRRVNFALQENPGRSRKLHGVEGASKPAGARSSPDAQLKRCAP